MNTAHPQSAIGYLLSTIAYCLLPFLGLWTTDLDAHKFRSEIAFSTETADHEEERAKKKNQQFAAGRFVVLPRYDSI